MTQQHPDLADEQAYIDHAYECLDTSREAAWRMRNMTEADLGGTFQARFERNAFDEALIKRRQRTLDKARKQLKADFVGIDGIIDQLCSYVRIWYLMPEILTRPVIVNLWGMTGVGKTDLVRRLGDHGDARAG